MFISRKIRYTNISQSVSLCQRNYLFFVEGILNNALLRTCSSSCTSLTKSEPSLISSTNTESKSLSNDALQSHLDRYNDRQIIFNSITFKWDPHPNFFKRQARKQWRVQNILTSESILYQRFKNTGEIPQNQCTDGHQSESSPCQTSSGCEINTPVIFTANKQKESYGSNLNSFEKGDWSTHSEFRDGIEKNSLVSEHASEESVSALHKKVTQIEQKNSDKLQKDIIIGSANESVPKSAVPCGGCGALQHCQDPRLPGFKPFEKFVGRSDDELRLTVCYRCHFLAGFDLLVPTVQSPESYRTLLKPVKSLSSLVLLLVDLTDAPCSIHPATLQIIARRQPLIVVGSKVDLLPLSGPTCLSRVGQSLDALIQRTPLADANILDTVLVSGHTGYGVENLVSSIYKNFHQKGKFLGDVFLVGCTNSGKSTLYNELLQSDLSDQLADTCSVRSTVSTWPATTVNLIKFPMLWWTPWHSQSAGCGDKIPPPVKWLRIERLYREKKEQKEALLSSEQFTRNPALATLTGSVGRTNVMDGPPIQTKLPSGSNANLKNRKIMKKMEDEEVISYDPESQEFGGHQYCYDTPGLVQPHQFLGMLTQEELRLVLPDRLIVPETFRLRPGMSLFVGGLARLDVLHLHDDTADTRNSNWVKVTVFRSRALPVSIVWSVKASSFYRDYLGSSLLRVPMGSSERLRQWPALKPSNITAVGVHYNEADADVVLSSAGWVSLCLSPGAECSLRAWTPDGRGAFLRDPPFLPLAGKETQPIANHSVLHHRNKLYVAQRKPEVLEPVESDDSVTKFPAIADGRYSSGIYLGQASQRALLPEIPDHSSRYDQEEQEDTSGFYSA